MGVYETLFLLFASQALAAPVDGQEGTKNAAGQNGVLHLPLVHFAKEVDVRDIEKRGFSTPLDYFKYDGKNAVTAVGIVLDVGTPPQKVILEPDTGSSKFWLLGLKPGDTRGNEPSAYFDQKQSQSLQDMNKEDGAGYGSGERVTYNMVSDKVSFEGKGIIYSIPKFQTQLTHAIRLILRPDEIRCGQLDRSSHKFGAPCRRNGFNTRPQG